MRLTFFNFGKVVFSINITVINIHRQLSKYVNEQKFCEAENSSRDLSFKDMNYILDINYSVLQSARHGVDAADAYKKSSFVKLNLKLFQVHIDEYLCNPMMFR